MKKYPIGIQNFRKLREEGYTYVDKTEIIYRLLMQGSYYFLSRPRRFGKSLLLSTIHEICAGSRELFKGLWIENHWDWDKKYAVIHFKFSKSDYQELGLRQALISELDKSAAILQLQLSKPTLKERFEELLIKAAAQGRVVLLIDEYDKPIIDYIEQPEKANENREILKQFYSIVKDSDAYIHFLLITGVSKFSKVSIFSDLNNLEDITISKSMNDILGITQQELETHFQEDIKTKAGRFETTVDTFLQQIKEWYNGYNWGGDNTLYNPFSILSFFKQEQFNNFWFSTGTPTFLVNIIRKAGQFVLDDDKYTSLNALSQFDVNHIEVKPILFQTGYLTFAKVNFAEDSCQLKYPNKEVKASLEQYLLAAYQHGQLGDALPLVLRMRDAFQRNDIAQVIEVINTAFSTIPYDLWRGATELHYHALVHLTFSLLGSYIQSEVHTSKGRCDALIKTPTHIYALEFKLDKTAEEARDQIFEKGYLTPYIYEAQQKVAVGINFSSELKKVESYLIEYLVTNNQ